MRNVFGLLSLGAWLAIAAGCGESQPSGTVSGTVTKDGKPIAAQVAFKNDTSTAAGISDTSSGAYVLMNGESEGIPVGTYQVAVSDVSGEVDTEAADYAAMMSGGGAPATTSAIPKKYNAYGTSGLTYTVKDGDNTFDIDLK